METLALVLQRIHVLSTKNKSLKTHTAKMLSKPIFNIYNHLCREYIPQNIMHDKRVVRGSTHAAMVIPAGTYPDTLFSGGSPTKHN